MKSREGRLIRLFLAAAAGILALAGVFYLFDHVLNGMFVEWFEKNYMITYEEYLADAGAVGYVHRPDWDKVKELAFVLLLFSIFTGAGICWLLSRVHTERLKKEIRERIGDLGKRMQGYMFSDKEVSEIFPEEYQEITPWMAEIKIKLRRHEQTLKEENKRKNDLLTYLAHDLKTPLTSVIGYLCLLSEAPDMQPGQREKYLNITLEKARRLEGLLNEFFDITRYNLQQISLEKSPIHLSYMLVQMTDEFYPLLRRHGNTVKLRTEEDLIIQGDSAKLARVFNNILKNAAAYSDPDTEICVTARKNGEYVEILFSNEGPVIPEDKLELIFEKFIRLDEARAGNTGGAGLGLAIAKEIVKLHGGRIEASSSRGHTVFSVTLPIDGKISSDS